MVIHLINTETPSGSIISVLLRLLANEETDREILGFSKSTRPGNGQRLEPGALSNASGSLPPCHCPARPRNHVSGRDDHKIRIVS